MLQKRMGAPMSRFQHLRTILGPSWHYLIALPFAVTGVFTWIRDEWLSPETAAMLKMPALVREFLPAWLLTAQWYWWAIATLVVIAVLFFEGSFRERRRFLAVHLAAKDNPKPIIGDMPIQDVFFHIDADVLENGTFETVGQLILDHLSTGQLTAYGRQASFENRGYVGHPNLGSGPIKIPLGANL